MEVLWEQMRLNRPKYKEEGILEKKLKIDPTKSRFADRDTVGKMYRDAQINNREDKITVGDLTNEILSSLVEDLNDTIDSKPYDNKRPYYICIVDKKDLMMKRAIIRSIQTTVYRPWPEDDTTVFYIDPVLNEVRFCWCIPHNTEIFNIIANENLYDADLVAKLKAWRKVDLYHFGFRKNDKGEWEGNPAAIRNDQLLSINKPIGCQIHVAG
jgi:hypothetical protein